MIVILVTIGGELWSSSERNYSGTDELGNTNKITAIINTFVAEIKI
jgi:hypothetical protein